MKKPFLSLLLFISWASLYAQPVPDASLAPLVGTRSLISVGNTGTYGIPSFGANQTWDYTSLNGIPLQTTTTLIETQGPNTSADGLMGSFTTVTHRRSPSGTDSIDAYQYKLSNSEGMYEAGIYAPGQVRSSPNQQLILKYGLALGAMYKDTSFQLLYDPSGTTVVQRIHYRDSIAYLGYGTLTLPNGDVYPNALLTQRGFYGRNDTGNYSAILVDSYDWYVPNGTGFPVLTLITDSVFSPLYFYTHRVVTDVKKQTAALKLSVMPNPCREFLAIQGLLPYQTTTIQILSSDGKPVLTMGRFPALGKLSVGSLPVGVYTAVVTASGQTHRLRFTKE